MKDLGKDGRFVHTVVRIIIQGAIVLKDEESIPLTKTLMVFVCVCAHAFVSFRFLSRLKCVPGFEISIVRGKSVGFLK